MAGTIEFTKPSDALKKLLAEASVNLDGEYVDLVDAVGRYAYREYVSKVDLPPFNRSAVDGVAARFVDIAGASESSPILLKLTGSVDVDSTEIPVLKQSEAILISTGAPIPSGADVVIPVEYCAISGDLVYIYRTYPKYANISLRGEDLRVGSIIVRRGTKLRPWHIAALAASGYSQIEVFRKPRIAVVNTGNEIVRGVIPNVTYYVVTSYVRELGGEVVYSRVVSDDIDEIARTLREAVEVSDVVVVTGGTSVGARDVVPKALLKLEYSREVFRGVRIRPGRTASAYVVRGKPVILVSGLPVAAYISLDLLLPPLLGKACSTPFEFELKPSIVGKLIRKLPNEVGFRSFYRVIACRDRDEVLIIPLRLTGSGILSTLIKGNAILEIPEDFEGYEEGSIVKVTLINPLVNCSDIVNGGHDLKRGDSTQ
ncbi:MAG: molybdopterin molybdotransferase MoeA [Sulfolobales archaeon]|nr:molybdopterin molybdotransferase MoeA [Sulfolobales archaeon]MDW8082385.1 molybdopterin molybdotransferase MoeA [Sulfolobales archaeon]